MCGIAGILRKAGSAPIGEYLLAMASCLQHRGMDSAGVAVFQEPGPEPRIRVMTPAGTVLPEPQMLMAITAGRLHGLQVEQDGFSAALRQIDDSPLADDLGLICALERAIPGATVSALGSSLTVEKVVGLTDGLQATVGALTGTHGIAHLRLATESRIDPAHAQPFWGRPFPDIAVTHNGHITNYHKLRQKFEAAGLSFASRNDSEIIGVYLGDKMAQGASVREALEQAAGELDGSYSFIVATPQGLGVTRDPFATKPLLYAETEDGVALASEPQALHRLLGEAIKISEIRPREVRTWERD